MKFFHIAIFCTAGLFFSACSGNKEQSKNLTAPSPEKSINIPLASMGSNKDLACGMPLKQGEIADTATYDGKVYGFCSSVCKSDFMASPAKYLNQK